MRRALFLLCACTLVLHAEAKVEELTPENFKAKVAMSDQVWAVEFYAPWCGHCKALKPDWDKFGAAVSPHIRVGAVDADKHKDLAGEYGVKGFPTIKFFAPGKKPEDYNEGRTPNALAAKAMKLLGEHINSKLGGSQKSSGGSTGGGEKKKAGKEAVVHLTTSDFKKKVLEGGEEWLVAFIAPWCGHCKKLHPEWEDAAQDLKGEYNLGMVDATVEQELGQEYNVKGYPTIKHFKMENGKIKAADYQGGRTASDIIQYVNARIESTGSALPIPQIVDTASFEKVCNADRGGICVVAFLPHILDDQAAGRNARLEKLMDARKKVGRTFKFAWVEGGENGEIEDKMGLGFGYPALIALSPTKKKFAVMRQAFLSDNIDFFLNRVLKGKESTIDVKPWPMKWRKSQPWDGKDGSLDDGVDTDGIEEL